jgi:hypothetical protein
VAEIGLMDHCEWLHGTDSCGAFETGFCQTRFSDRSPCRSNAYLIVRQHSHRSHSRIVSLDAWRLLATPSGLVVCVCVGGCMCERVRKQFDSDSTQFVTL